MSCGWSCGIIVPSPPTFPRCRLLFDQFLYLCLYRSISHSNDYLLDPLCHIKAQALPRTSRDLVDECHSNQCAKSRADIFPGSLECFRNPRQIYDPISPSSGKSASSLPPPSGGAGWVKRLIYRRRIRSLKVLQRAASVHRCSSSVWSAS